MHGIDCGCGDVAQDYCCFNEVGISGVTLDKKYYKTLQDEVACMGMGRSMG